MNLQQKFKLGSYITSKKGQPFQWGINDCNTFFTEYSDMFYNTEDTKRIKGQYLDRRSGIKFWRNLGLTPAQWLHMRGWEKIDDDYADGDIIVFERKAYSSVYIYFDGAFWTVAENEECKGYHPTAFENLKTQGWRHG